MTPCFGLSFRWLHGLSWPEPSDPAQFGNQVEAFYFEKPCTPALAPAPLIHASHNAMLWAFSDTYATPACPHGYPNPLQSRNDAHTDKTTSTAVDSKVGCIWHLSHPPPLTQH
ncbi:hypothetical protein DUNSADRAFT_7 [Dunaliella salina]|uniref:Encoded protein n=1 Tax=Dunaliella salina TaxID=3046 RepID=A0ABQ7HAK7_DUNSA|nr:hypothetical protein DUNSADRAFT_7 [Dunaliella salina]|eukprot:KAF5843885.1 hypothetical protein DUNSADRAFT_7 [Dunaliella salina]